MGNTKNDACGGRQGDEVQVTFKLEKNATKKDVKVGDKHGSDWESDRVNGSIEGAAA